MSTLFIMFTLLFLILCFLCITWLHRDKDTSKPLEEGFEQTTAVRTTTSFTGLPGTSVTSAIFAGSGAGSTASYSYLDGGGSKAGSSGPSLPFFTSISNTFTQTPYDSYYDLYEQNESNKLTDIVNNFNFLNPPAATVTTNSGQSLGVCDLTANSIPWDTENASAKQSDIVWGVVSQEASKSLFLKTCLQAIASNSKSFNACGSDDPSSFCYTSPYLRVSTTNIAAADGLAVADGILSSTGGALSQLVMQRIEAQEHAANHATNPVKDIVHVAEHAIETKPNTKVGVGMSIAAGTKRVGGWISKLKARVMEGLKIDSKKVRSSVAVGSGAALGTAAGALAVSTATNAATAGANSFWVLFWGAVVSFMTFFFGAFGLIMMVLEGFLDPIVQNLFRTGGLCPAGSNPFSSMIDATVAGVLYGLIPGLSLLSTFDPYVCWASPNPSQIATMTLGGVVGMVATVTQLVKLRVPPKIPWFFFDRSLSLVYHSSFVSGMTDVGQVSFLPNSTGPKRVCDAIPAGYYYPDDPASDLSTLGSSLNAGSMLSYAYSGSYATSTVYGSSNSTCKGPFVAKNCPPGTTSSPDGLQCIENVTETDVKMPSMTSCPSGTVENQGHCWKVSSGEAFPYTGGICTYSTRDDGVWNASTGLYKIVCSDLLNLNGTVACTATQLQNGTCSSSAGISIVQYAFQRLQCPVGYEKDNQNYGTLCYKSCPATPGGGSNLSNRVGAYCHSGVPSHTRNFLPTKISLLETDQSYNPNMDLSDVVIPYCDFSDPIMLDRMANFYYSSSSAHPEINSDGTITTQLISRFFGVVASSELSCDVACEIQFITYNPYTGGDFSIKMGCELPSDPAFANVPHPFCYRRFYFIRGPNDPQGIFTVTGCTHQDYTAPDGMICSAQPYANPLVSLPKKFKKHDLQASLYDWAHFNEELHSGRLMADIGIAQLSNGINLVAGFAVGAALGAAGGALAGRLAARAAATAATDVTTRAAAGAIERGVADAAAQGASEAAAEAAAASLRAAAAAAEQPASEALAAAAAAAEAKSVTAAAEAAAAAKFASADAAAAVERIAAGQVSGPFLPQTIAAAEKASQEVIDKAVNKFLNSWTYTIMDGIIQLGAGTGVGIGTTKMTDLLKQLAGTYERNMNVDNVVNTDIVGTAEGGFKVLFKDNWWVLDMGSIYELAPAYKPNIKWCSTNYISPDYCSHKYIVRDFVDSYHAANGGYHIKKISSIEARGKTGCYYKIQKVTYDPLQDIEGRVLEEEAVIQEHTISDYATCTYKALGSPFPFTVTDSTQYPIRSTSDPVTRATIYPFHIQKYTSLLNARYVRIRSDNTHILNIANISVYDISGINVALRKPVNVTSTDPSSQPANTTVDGTVSYNNFAIPSWKPMTANTSEYLEIDLGINMNISYVVFCGGDVNNIGVHIQFLYSNSANETPIYDIQIAGTMAAKVLASGSSTNYVASDYVYTVNIYNTYQLNGKTGSSTMVSKYPIAGPIEIPRPLGSASQKLTLGAGLCSTTCQDASVIESIMTQYNSQAFTKADPTSQLIKVLRGVTVTSTKCEYEGEFTSVVAAGSSSNPSTMTVSKHFFTAEVVPPAVPDSSKLRANKIRILPARNGILEVSKIAVYNSYTDVCEGAGSSGGSTPMCTFHDNVASDAPVNIYNFVRTMAPNLIESNLVAVYSEADLQPQTYPNLYISRTADNTAFIDVYLQWASDGSATGSANTNNITELNQIVFVGRGADRQPGNIIGTQIQAIVEDINGNDTVIKTWKLPTDDTVQRISCLPPCSYTLTNFTFLPKPNSLPLIEPPPINNKPYRDTFTSPDASGGVFSFKQSIGSLKSVINSVLPMTATDPLVPVVDQLKVVDTSAHAILDNISQSMYIQNTTQKCSDPAVLREFMTTYNMVNTPNDEFGVEQHTMRRILKAGPSTPNTCDVLYEDVTDLYDDFLSAPSQTYTAVKATRFEMTTVNDLNHDGIVRVAPGPNAIYDISSNAIGVISDTSTITPVYGGPVCSVNCMDPLLLARVKKELELLPQASSAGLSVTSTFNTVTQSLQRSPNTCEYHMLKTNIYGDKTLHISTTMTGVDTYVRATVQLNQDCSYMYTGVQEYPVDDITYTQNKNTGDFAFYLNGKVVTVPSLFNYDARTPSAKVKNTVYSFTADPPSNFCAERWTAGTYCPDNTKSPVRCLQGYYCPTIGTVVAPTYNMTGTTANYLLRTAEDPTTGEWIYGGPGNTGGSGSRRTTTKCLPAKYCPHPDMQYLTDCPKGFYCPTGASMPTVCDPGTYTITSNQVVAATCPVGFFCANPGTVTPAACPPGKYSPTTGATDCTPCPVGKFCNAATTDPITGLTGGTITPTVCPIGQYQDQTGQAACKPSTVGNFCPTTGMTTPTPCPVGSYCPTTGLSAPTPCPPGQYCPSMGGSTTTPCPPGTYCPNQGSSTATPCPVGTYCPSAGSSSYNQCPIGGICPIPGGSQSQLCPPGQFCPTTGEGSMGSLCPPGTYSTGGVTISCTQCPFGTYSTATGATSSATCITCPVGKFCLAGTSIPGSTCPAGYYCPPSASGSGSRSGSAGSLAGTLQACPAGKTSVAGSTTLAQCTNCPAGTYCPTTATSIPVQCQAGTASATPGAVSATTCVACVAGTYQDQQGQATCKPCQAGNQCPTAGMTAQTACTPGTYQASASATSCTRCPPGSFSATSSATVCATCQPGTYCPGGGSTSVACQPGTYCPSTGGSTALQCPIGTYCPIQGMSAGSPCPPGAYCPTLGDSTAAAQCPAGTYSTGGAGSGCTPCPAGSFCPTTNAAPQSCPAGKYSAANATFCSTCSAGSYSLGGTSSCTSCPAGSYCPSITSTSVICPVATYNPSTNQASLEACQTCPTGQYCVPTATVGCTTPAASCPAAGTVIPRIVTTVIPYPGYYNSSPNNANNSAIVAQTSAGTMHNSPGFGQLITGIVFDSAYNMYVADSTNRVIRKFTYVSTPTNSGLTGSGKTTNWVEQSTLVNTVKQPFAGTFSASGWADGAAGTATFYAISGMAIDTNNIIYVADTIHSIRRIDTLGNTTTILGGNGVSGVVPANTVGSTSTGAAARLNHPMGLTIDTANNLYVSDADNSRILKVLTTSPYTTTVINTGTQYFSMACDGTNIYAATFTSIFKFVPSGSTWTKSQITYAGTNINAMTWRGTGLFVFDTNVVYKVSPSIAKTAVLGSSTAGTADNSITTSTSNFTSRTFVPGSPAFSALVFDRNNNLFMTDTYDRIRMIRPYLDCA